MTTETTTTPKLTDRSFALFLGYANDACNWSGTPMVGGNVGRGKDWCGNLTDLKKAGLLATFESDGFYFVNFTDAGVKFAAKFGIVIKR